MPHYRLTGLFTVERDFTCEADSEEEAREHPELWEEDGDEVTKDRLSLEVDEIIPDLADAADAAEQLMEDVNYFGEAEQDFLTAYDRVAAAIEDTSLDLRAALQSFLTLAEKHEGQDVDIDQCLDVIRKALEATDQEATADALE